jgi:hypothetical protein
MKAPKSVVDMKGQPFPVGTFISAEHEVTESWRSSVKENPDLKDCLDLALVLKSNTPTDESPTVGKRPMTQRIPVVFKNQSVVDVEDFDDPNLSFALQRGAGLLSQLALALGATTRAEDGSVDFDAETFLAALVSGQYKSTPIGFQVIHRNWSSKATGKSGTSAEVNAFFPVE